MALALRYLGRTRAARQLWPICADLAQRIRGRRGYGRHSTYQIAETYIFTGDRLLDFEDICDIYSEASGKPLRYRSCSIEEYVAATSTRIDEPWPRAFASLCASIGEGRYNFTTRNFAAVVRREPESFRDFLLRTITPIAQDDIAEF